MKLLGLIEKDLDVVSKEYVDEKFSNHQTHLEELDKKIGSNNAEFEKLNGEFKQLITKARG
ncbi:Uncharacterised protein [Peptostreptococcus anaerobius]|uniref:Uncharacterized protein n=1 Tax=Peptostreptococcus anaerobius TaxID=1261 RepID=A0A379CI88_9FIRM|nr:MULTISPECIES: hypothetical protein [Peptostreptococcus]MDU5350036.1 hypothetical protein [Peptostreptococcus sp.]MDU5891526.1 hypothetical protein [Peptostreptococcus sp.]SFM86692.1 hypothetical protein SAMN05660467_00637 [Peptostreptococcus anaerobius]SUB62141.1 Uncharacterised protein [Peptostreptococcus anaerobius]